MPFLEHPETGVDRSAHEATSSCGGKATKALKSSVHGHLNGHPGRWLVVSPYTEDPHLLDLKAADRAQGLLAKALTRMEPTRNDYATATYSQSFNWTEVMLELKASIAATDSRWIPRTFFIVIFRSQVKATTDRSRLGAFDRSSHAEAMNSGGLLKYWFGVPDKDGRNLATCVWNRCEDSQRGGRGEAHREAVKATTNLYSEWNVERLGLEIGENADHWSIKEWRA